MKKPSQFLPILKQMQDALPQTSDGKKVYATEVVADDVILLGGRGEGSGGGGGADEFSQQPVSMPRAQSRPRTASAPQPEPGFTEGITDDDVPF